MIEITAEPIDIQKVIDAAYSDDCGALNTFIGTVRNHSHGKAVVRLEYEAYPEMAGKMIQRIIDEAKKQWPVRKIAVSHRIGVLDIGETAVVIAVSTPHRKEGFAACQYVIDRLKAIVPIWKKEVAADGETWVSEHP